MNNFTEKKIVSIKSLGIQRVYDISVDIDESYLSQGFVNHNSSKPINLQNQPKEKGMIRKAFVASLPGDKESDLVLLNGDHSQFELRMAAHLAKEPTLMSIYNAGNICTCERFLQYHECKNSDPSIKCRWGGLLGPDKEKKCPKCGYEARPKLSCVHTDIHQCTSEQVGVSRDISKNLNFGTLYKIGGLKFAISADLFDDQGNPREDYAKELINKWTDTYWRIPEWWYEEEIRLRQNSWVAYTLTGRRRRLEKERQFNEYGAVTQGLNFLVQGCLDKNSKVLTNNGYVQIDKLKEDDIKIFDGQTFTNNFSLNKTGEKECVKVTTHTGVNLISSLNHRFMFLDGDKVIWKESKDLKVGDRIGSKAFPAPDGITDGGTYNDTYLIGALIGDGSYNSPNGFTIACSYKEPDWGNSLVNSIKSTFGSYIDKKVSVIAQERVLKTGKKHLVNIIRVYSADARNHLLLMGLDQVAKLDKIIPEWIFTAPFEARASFIAGLIDTDGTIVLNKNNKGISCVPTINYSSRCKHLVEGFHRILSSLGIESSIYTIISPGDKKEYYRCGIHNDSISLAKKVIKSRHPRKLKALLSMEEINGTRGARYPVGFLKTVAEFAKKQPIMEKRKINRYKKTFTDQILRERIQTFIGYLSKGEGGLKMMTSVLEYVGKPNEFKEIIETHWIEIVDIQSVGLRETYDIELFGENHAYIVDGVYTHNSTQDIMKLGMIAVYNERERLKGMVGPEERKLLKRFKFLAQIHDEVLWELPSKIADETADWVKKKMQNVAKLRVPLNFDIRVGKPGDSWEDTH